MTTLVKNIKLIEDYSYLAFDPFNCISGELVVEMNGLSVTFDVGARYEVETYEDYDGYPTTEFGGIYDIELSVQVAWTINEYGDTEDIVPYKLDNKDLSALEVLVEHIYCNTEPDLAELKREYKSCMEEF